MSQLYAGFARVDVIPMMGILMEGYYSDREAESVLDALEVNALALMDGEKKALMMSIDNCVLWPDVADAYKKHVSETTGVPEDAICIHATHTHTGPNLKLKTGYELEKEYFQFVYRRMADAAKFALDDLKPVAKAGWGVGIAPEIAFIRRFKMKDGSTQTNPTRNDSNIDHPIGEPDRRVNVLRFDRECGDHLILANYGNHPDVIGGCKISADWPGHIRGEVEKFIAGSKCIFFNGCQGDVNHINFFPNRTEKDFMDNAGKYGGYEHSKYMARALAGTVAQVYDKTMAMEDTELRFLQKNVRVPSAMPTPEQIPEAHRIYDLWKAGRADELPYTGMMNTTVVAEACRMVELENGPEFFDMPVSAVAVGKVVFVGLPGEPFTGVGKGIKDAEGWDMIMPACITNGYFNYFPMQEAYDEGGYEARSSKFKPGVAEKLIAAGKELMDELKK